MKAPKPFIFEPSDSLVTASQAADLVTEEGANCHDFRINHDHRVPDLENLKKELLDLRLIPEDGEAYLLYQCLCESIDAAEHGSYGIAAILAKVRSDSIQIIEKAQNARGRDSENPFFDHAEMRLIHQATPYLQTKDRFPDTLCVNLSPCPACIGHVVSARMHEVLIGSIDPEVGAGFLKGQNLRYALGAARARRVEDEEHVYRFPSISDKELREELLRLSWEIFHTSKRTTPSYKPL